MNEVTLTAEQIKAIKLKEARNRFIEAIQPDPVKRKRILASLHYFMKNEGLKLESFSDENQSLLISGLMRIGIEVSKDTVYPRIHDISIKDRDGNYTKKQILIIQDNYLFLQQLLLQHLKAKALVIDVIFEQEYQYLVENKIGTFVGKDSVLPIYAVDEEGKAENIKFIQISVAFDHDKFGYTTLYSMDRINNRIGLRGRSGMIFKNTKDTKFHNHCVIEMYKKHVIRAFAKEKFGSALNVIRAIDIAQVELENRYTDQYAADDVVVTPEHDKQINDINQAADVNKQQEKVSRADLQATADTN